MAMGYDSGDRAGLSVLVNAIGRFRNNWLNGFAAELLDTHTSLD